MIKVKENCCQIGSPPPNVWINNIYMVFSHNDPVINARIAQIGLIES